MRPCSEFNNCLIAQAKVLYLVCSTKNSQCRLRQGIAFAIVLIRNMGVIGTFDAPRHSATSTIKISCSMHCVLTWMCVLLHLSVIPQVGNTALIMAARHGHTEVVVELMKANANLDLQDTVCIS